ncbi:hypothetical protein [Streptomyces sp. AD55]
MSTHDPRECRDPRNCLACATRRHPAGRRHLPTLLIGQTRRNGENGRPE